LTSRKARNKRGKRKSQTISREGRRGGSARSGIHLNSVNCEEDREKKEEAAELITTIININTWKEQRGGTSRTEGGKRGRGKKGRQSGHSLLNGRRKKKEREESVRKSNSSHFQPSAKG